jgi:hypothetical protein
MMTRLFGAVFGGAQAGNVKMVSPADVRQWIDAGQAVVIDVREVGEHAAERIKGAINLPLSTFEVSQLAAWPPPKRWVPAMAVKSTVWKAASWLGGPWGTRSSRLGIVSASLNLQGILPHCSRLKGLSTLVAAGSFP